MELIYLRFCQRIYLIIRSIFIFFRIIISDAKRLYFFYLSHAVQSQDLPHRFGAKRRLRLQTAQSVFI